MLCVATASRRVLVTPLSVCGYTTSLPSFQTLQLLQSDIARCSNGQLNLSVDVYPSYVKQPCLGVCDTDGWAKNPPTPGYQHYVYIVPNAICNNWAGLGEIGGMNSWINEQYKNAVATYMHELGHNMGLGHASTRKDEYGDLTDSMGRCCDRRANCYNPIHTEQLGWTTPQAVLASTSKSRTITITSYIKIITPYTWYYVQKQSHHMYVYSTPPYNKKDKPKTRFEGELQTYLDLPKLTLIRNATTITLMWRT